MSNESNESTTLMHTRGRRYEGIDNDIKEGSEKRLQEICMVPFEERTAKKILYVKVTTKPGYEDTIDELVKLTVSSVEEHVASESSVTVAIAQQVGPGVEIDVSTKVERKKYWRGLAYGTKSLKSCLEVIHRDVVTVWEFDDQYHLLSTEFQISMYNLVSDLDCKNLGSVIPRLEGGSSMTKR